MAGKWARQDTLQRLCPIERPLEQKGALEASSERWEQSIPHLKKKCQHIKAFPGQLAEVTRAPTWSLAIHHTLDMSDRS